MSYKQFSFDYTWRQQDDTIKKRIRRIRKIQTILSKINDTPNIY